MDEVCPGCGACLPAIDGPVHKYMTSSAACFTAFNEILAAEYSSALLMRDHSLTVDAYAAQHPGDPSDRRCVQSVGLHLARLYMALERNAQPQDLNAIMQRFAEDKASLRALTAPLTFQITASDVAPFAGTPQHASKTRDWALATWQDWSDHHNTIARWADAHVA